MPAAITAAAATRRIPNCSFRNIIAMSAAKITLVSLIAATSATDFAFDGASNLHGR